MITQPLISNSISERINNSFLEERALFLSRPIDNETAEELIALLLHLDLLSHDPISLFINSPGGSVSAGFGIIDCMNGIRSPVRTYAFGVAASMSALILANGELGFRSAFPNAKMLLHQPFSCTEEMQSDDAKIISDSLCVAKKQIINQLAISTKLGVHEIEKIMSESSWIPANRAKEYGLIDFISSDWALKQHE